ncbi:MAG: ATP-binding cassette domain-containing protein [Deltaproteobacteria bacterium]|nr:ATP-binding cassette domain-containing protein [Deltaproteobacteria bacterium]NIS76649.1 ATP-binding cassette domain-containing protein [Deltaproteobacteria bacterium]
MKDGFALKVENVSKKYCKSIKRSMLYGIWDIARNTVGLSSHSARLRKGEFWAVDDVSFEMRRGETLGIIGPNGSGKTTLLKMLNGIFWPDRGKISVRGKMGALIAVGAGFHPLLSGRENVYVNAAILGMAKREVDEKLDAIVDFAGIHDFIDVPVKHYSSGMFVRLGFAVAAYCEPDILLIDEVLAVGDEGFQKKCFDKIGEMKKNGMTTLIVSHNMHVISTFAERLILLNGGKVKLFDNVPDGIREYKRLFSDDGETGIEAICTGNENIAFTDIEFNSDVLFPGESFSLSMRYDSGVDYPDVDIDTAIFSDDEKGLYFQATNRAYDKLIDLKKGNHRLEIVIRDIRINDTNGNVSVALWSKGRGELLFWWRIPVEFKGVDYATGRNFLAVTYDITEID